MFQEQFYSKYKRHWHYSHSGSCQKQLSRHARHCSGLRSIKDLQIRTKSFFFFFFKSSWSSHISSKSWNNPVKAGTTSPPVHRWRIWGTERFRTFSRSPGLKQQQQKTPHQDSSPGSLTAEPTFQMTMKYLFSFWPTTKCISTVILYESGLPVYILIPTFQKLNENSKGRYKKQTKILVMSEAHYGLCGHISSPRTLSLNTFCPSVIITRAPFTLKSILF